MKNRKAKILLVRRNAPGVWQWVRLSNRRMGLMKYYGMMDCGFCKSPARSKTAGKTTCALKESDMAIAASYTMHLYCDCLQCTDGKYKSPDFGEYIGTSWAGCAKEARKDGWRISKDKTRAFAPGHKILRSNKGE